MLTVAFAAIPYFLVSQTKTQTAAISTAARTNQAKIVAIHKNLNPDIARGASTYVYETSNGRAQTVASKFGQVVRVKIVKGGEHLVSPVSFEAPAENKVKRGKPNET